MAPSKKEEEKHGANTVYRNKHKQNKDSRPAKKHSVFMFTVSTIKVTVSSTL